MRVVRGDATPEEIAALVTAIATRRSSHAEPEAPPVPRRQRWRNPARGMRNPVVPGKSAWRMSALP
nr:acyl-CoA carboxylase subunit epsilon [Nonomuraea basaltis]